MDPQLHAPAVIAAKVQDPTGRWLALDARFLKRQQRTISAIYDAALRSELRARLGVRWREHDGVADLDCIPAEVRELFSKRSGQVEQRLAGLVERWVLDHDGAEPDQQTIAGLTRLAALDSRPPKSAGIDATTLKAHWVGQASAIGFDPATLVAERIRRASAPPARSDDRAIVDEALRRVAQERASWLRADLARHLAALLAPIDGHGAEDLTAEIDRLTALAEQGCVVLGPEPTDTRRRKDGRPITEAVTDRLLSTSEVLHQETELDEWAKGAVAPVHQTEDPQADAERAITGNADLVLLVGPAGTGKTHATAAAVADLARSGRRVVGLAPSGKAADVLAAEAGCRTDTVAGFLARHRCRRSLWPAGTTVILDEAGMIATEDLADLVDLVQHNRWRIVAVGDPEQLPSVARGGVFARWCTTLDHHALHSPRRFDQPWKAAASLGLRAGRSDAVEAYAAHGRLAAAHPALIPRRVALAHERHVDAGRSVAITTNTAEAARAINQAIQRLRRRTGGRADLHDGTTVWAGDTIATRHNDRRQATDTGYGNQGDTVDVGLAVLDPTSTRNHVYVALTRGRQTNVAPLVDPDCTVDATARLADIVARTANGESALDTRDRLHRAAGRPAPQLVSPERNPDHAIARPPDGLPNQRQPDPSLGF